MSVSHYMEHLKRDFSLWKMNMDRAINLRQDLRVDDGTYIYRRGSAADYKAIQNLHYMLFRQGVVNWLNWLYKFKANELMSVVEEKSTGKIVGYDLFMFNEGEIKDDYLHEQYIGIDPSCQGQSLSVKLRRYSLDCYDSGSVRAISTLAKVDDIKALRSAQKAGFYITKMSAKPRAHYLVYNLTTYR